MDEIQNLINIQKERLEIALKWEKDKGIVVPETSTIINCILKLQSLSPGSELTPNTETEGKNKAATDDMDYWS